jgi:hypothetical protein
VNNNRAQTVKRGFMEACEKFGYPSRVRADMGGELLRVRDIMIAVRGQLADLLALYTILSLRASS